MADWPAIRADAEAIYQAVGYAVEPAPWAPETAFIARRREAEVAVALPLAVEPKREAAQVLADAAAWRPDGARRIFVVGMPNNLSMGATFQTDIAKAGGAMRAYTGLMDGGYSGQRYIGLAQPGAYDTYEDLRIDLTRDKAVRERRVPQRFLTGPDWREGKGDLLDHMIAMLDQPAERPQIVFLSGVGGAGKTVLFKALFAHLYAKFNLLKQRFILAARPIPVTPDEIRREPADGTARLLPRNAPELFDAVSATSYGAATEGNGALLAHLVARGRNILMFDGLDEFYGGADFEPELARRFLPNGSTAQIVIVLRDSLYAAMSPADPGIARTIEALRASLGPASVHQFELARWEMEREHRALAWKVLTRQWPPAEPAPDVRAFDVRHAREVADYFAWLDARPAIANLTDVPFYADLALTLHQLQAEAAAGGGDAATGAEDGPHDEQTLVETAIKAIVKREFDKLNKGRNTPVEHLFASSREIAIEENPPSEAMLDNLLLDARIRGQFSSTAYYQFGEATRFIIAVQSGIAGSHGGQRLYNLLCCIAYLRRRMPAFVAPETEGLWRRLLAQLGLVIPRDVGVYDVPIPDARKGINAPLLDALYDSLLLGHDRDDEDLAKQILRQFVLFRAGAEAGTIDFTHEAIADFMAAEHIVNRVKAANGGLRYLRALVGTPIEGEAPIFESRLRARLGDDFERGLMHRAPHNTTREHAADARDVEHVW